jgi:MFS family permease
VLFGQLTDRLGRKRLFLITLGVYLVGTVLTAFSMNPTWYFACRFVTGAGIGGRVRRDQLRDRRAHPGDPTVVAADIGSRLAFALGAMLGLGILLVRRNVPESPRRFWDPGRFERAIVAAIANGRITQRGDGRYSAV